MLRHFRLYFASMLPAAALLLIAAPALSATPPDRRIPADYKWGRCLLVVQGQTRIKGKCT